MARLFTTGLSNRPTRYRPTANDCATALERVVTVLGPVAGLDVGRVRELLNRAGASDPATRITLVPRVGSRTWEYRALDTDQAVFTLPDIDTSDLGKLLTEIGNRPGERQPLEVFICGEYLVVDYPHGIGDGRFGVTLLAALASGKDEIACSLVKALPSYAAWLALGRHLVAHPASIRDVLTLRRENAEIVKTHGRIADTRQITDWKTSTHCETAFMEPESVSQLRTWASSYAAGSTTASVTVALWTAALRSEGVRTDERAVMLIDCRRYLSGEYKGAHGNFAVGMPIPLHPSPSEITRNVRQVIDSGWPAATLAYAEVTSWLTRRTEPPRSGLNEVPDRLRLVVSDLGRLAIDDKVTWANGQRHPQHAAYLEPDGPDAITLLVSEVAGGRTFTASFCTEMVEPGVIKRALNRMNTDPVGVLEAAHL